MLLGRRHRGCGRFSGHGALRPDLDLAGRLFTVLRQGHAQHAVLVVGRDLLAVDPLRQPQAAAELATHALHTVIALARRLPMPRARPLNHQSQSNTLSKSFRRVAKSMIGLVRLISSGCRLDSLRSHAERILQSLYRSLAGRSLAVPRRQQVAGRGGPKWAEVGCSPARPAQSLRCSGRQPSRLVTAANCELFFDCSAASI